MNTFSAFVTTSALLLCCLGVAAAAPDASTAAKPENGSLTAAAVANSKVDIKWDKQLSIAPQTYPAPGFDNKGVQALYYEGLPYKGKTTRVFAYIGMPARKAHEKVPAMVLVHGGGGTAYADWVRLWTSRGYAAIAMDTCGNTPNAEGPHAPNVPHEYGGPHSWGGFDQIGDPDYKNHWTYQAVGAVMLANSLLRSRPEVDAKRIGVTGISWGGYLTSIVAGVDKRFKFAVPVYGCGFIGDNSAWLGFLRDEAAGGTKWLGMWDPSRYLKQARMPILWVTGTNDIAYPLDSLQKSYRLVDKLSTLTIRIRMPHGHLGPGENPEEIHAFANHYLKGGPALAKIRKQQSDGKTVSVNFTSERPIARAELNFTKDRSGWTERFWDTAPATLDARNNAVTAALPSDVSVYYVSLIDDKGHVVSTQHVEVPATK